MTIEFAAFDEADLADRQALFEDAFPEHRGSRTASIEHYRWKFASAPHTPTSYQYAAVEGGQMLGYYAAIPYEYEIAGRRMLVGMVCDVMTHSRARGRGVFTELGKFALSEMERDSQLKFVTGYPIRPEVMGGHMRVGWEVGFELPMYLKPLRADAILGSRGIGWLSPLANGAVSLQRAFCAARTQNAAYTLTTGDPRELFTAPSFKRFVDRWSESVPNHLVKSSAFYAWRLSAPGATYRAFLVLRGKEVVAMAVGRLSDLHGIPSLALLDCMVLGPERAALGPLCRALEGYAWQHDAEAIVTIMSRRRAREHRLRRFGFLQSPFKFKLILRSVSSSVSIDALSSEQDWHLMWIDSDDL